MQSNREISKAQLTPNRARSNPDLPEIPIFYGDTCVFVDDQALWQNGHLNDELISVLKKFGHTAIYLFMFIPFEDKNKAKIETLGQAFKAANIEGLRNELKPKNIQVKAVLTQYDLFWKDINIGISKSRSARNQPMLDDVLDNFISGQAFNDRKVKDFFDVSVEGVDKWLVALATIAKNEVNSISKEPIDVKAILYFFSIRKHELHKKFIIMISNNILLLEQCQAIHQKLCVDSSLPNKFQAVNKFDYSSLYHMRYFIEFLRVGDIFSFLDYRHHIADKYLPPEHMSEKLVFGEEKLKRQEMLKQTLRLVVLYELAQIDLTPEDIKKLFHFRLLFEAGPQCLGDGKIILENGYETLIIEIFDNCKTAYFFSLKSKLKKPDLQFQQMVALLPSDQNFLNKLTEIQVAMTVTSTVSDNKTDFTKTDERNADFAALDKQLGIPTISRQDDSEWEKYKNSNEAYQDFIKQNKLKTLNKFLERYPLPSLKKYFSLCDEVGINKNDITIPLCIFAKEVAALLHSKKGSRITIFDTNKNSPPKDRASLFITLLNDSSELKKGIAMCALLSEHSSDKKLQLAITNAFSLSSCKDVYDKAHVMTVHTFTKEQQIIINKAIDVLAKAHGSEEVRQALKEVEALEPMKNECSKLRP